MSNKRISQFTEAFSASTESFLTIVVDGNNFKIKKGNFIDSLPTPENADWSSTSGISEIFNKPIIYLPPFDTANNSYFPRNRDNSQFGPIGEFSYDFSDATLGAFGDNFGQVGQIGVNPDELYGSLGLTSYSFGYNVSNQGYGNTVFGTYNHSDTASQFATIFGRNNYNNSYATMLGGSFNSSPFTYLGHKTIFGNGNVVDGAAGFTSGVALINKSFGTTVLGQGNLDYANTKESNNLQTAPILIIGNGNVNVPVGLWSATYRSNALELLLNGLMTLPSVTNSLISADITGKAVITKEYLEANSGGVDDTAIHKTGDETITSGIKTFATGNVIVTNTGSFNTFGLKATTSGNGHGISVIATGNGAGINVTTSNDVSGGIVINSTGGGYGQYITNSSGHGLGVVSSGTSNGALLSHYGGYGLTIQTNTTGNGLILKQQSGSTGIPLIIRDSIGNNVLTISRTGVIKIDNLNIAPLSATDTGVKGEIRVVADYIYVCTATDTWVRTPLTTW